MNKKACNTESDIKQYTFATGLHTAFLRHKISKLLPSKAWIELL